MEKSWREESEKYFPVLYHLTHQHKRQSIFKNGLHPSNSTMELIQYHNRLHLLIDNKNIESIVPMICGTKFDLWKIDNTIIKIKVKKDYNTDSENCVYVEQVIASQYITLIKSWSEFI